MSYPVYLEYACGHKVIFEEPLPVFDRFIPLCSDDTIRMKELTMKCFVCTSNDKVKAYNGE